MIKVRLLEIYVVEYSDDDYVSHSYGLADATDWAVVTEQDYDALKAWVNNQRNKGRYFALVSELDITPEKEKIKFNDYLNEARAFKEHLEEQKNRRQVAEAKRAATVKEKAKARKLKQLAKLQAELKDAIV